MIEADGRRFAEQLLRFERAEQLAAPPTCSRCRTVLDVVQFRSRPQKNWYWMCRQRSGTTLCATAIPLAKGRDPLDWVPASVT